VCFAIARLLLYLDAA